MIYGYARVSTRDQSLEMQIDALHKAKCEIIFTEKISSAKTVRRELDKVLAMVVQGDTIVIWRLDRFGRSLHELLRIIKELEKKQVQLISLSDNIATNTNQGKLFLQIVAVFAEYERTLIRERTIAGIVAAKAKGRNGGRPKGTSPIIKSKVAMAFALIKQGGLACNKVFLEVGISRNTYYRNVALIEKVDI